MYVCMYVCIVMPSLRDRPCERQASFVRPALLVTNMTMPILIPPLVRDHLFLRQPFTCPKGGPLKVVLLLLCRFIVFGNSTQYNTFTYAGLHTKSAVSTTHGQKYSHSGLEYMRWSLLQRFRAHSDQHRSVYVCTEFVYFLRCM